MASLVRVAFWKSSSFPTLREITLDDIAHGLDDGRFTVVDLVETYIQRIQEVDDHFRSIIEINPDALTIAHDLDDEIRRSGRRGPLHGVPIILKDNIVTLDKMEATAGSFALLGAKPAHEATVATKLREAGCVLLGKAALTEWANYRWTNAATGWSPRRGQCTGPFYPNMKASGSSSGSAVATSLGLTFGALGTETDGSVCNPAGKAGVVGIKATVALASRDGIIPCSNRADAVGAFAKTVKDAAAVLTAISGKSNRDNATDKIPYQTIPDYVRLCEQQSLNGIRIGVPTAAIGNVEPEIAEDFRHALTALEKLGADIKHDVNFLAEDDWKMKTPSEGKKINRADFVPSLEKYFQTLVTNPNELHELADLIHYTKTEPREDYPNHNVDNFEVAESIDPESQEHKALEALRAFVVGAGGIEAALDRHQLDLLVTPTCSSIPVSFASLAGTPILSMPLGSYPPDKGIQKDAKSDLITVGPGIPYPICFFARQFGEETLIQVGHLFERVHDRGSPLKPYMEPKIELGQVVKDESSLRNSKV